MVSCRSFVSGLNEYLDHALDSAIQARFDHHIAVCPRCRIVCETTRKTVQLYKMWMPCEIPPAVESRLMAAIRTCEGRLKH